MHSGGNQSTGGVSSAVSVPPGMQASDLTAMVRLVHRALRYRYKLNPGEIREMLALMPRGGVGLDVGAHKGAYAWWMARRVGPQGRVLAFEPQKRVAEPAARAFARSGIRNVKYLNCAVSDRSGEATFAMQRGSTHGATLDRLEKGDVERVTVPLISLDEAAEQEGLTRVDFAKIDVEGHELKVIAGARRVIERWRPSMLIEAEHRITGAAPDPVQALRETLEAMGYRGYFFTRAGKQPIEGFSAAAHQTYGKGFYSNNFLYVHESVAGNRPA
ncbi:MAG TPA: FkbM family methyltransferase [Phycisphaerales bacterium]|nr:FkbM family methyltransferase [Phycisphaerales bacterium]